jgi:peptide/nickel transport system substrate-binding protein
LLALVLLLAVACGAGATTPAPEGEQEAAAPQAAESEEPEVAVENEQGEAVEATPVPTPEPVEAATETESIKKRDRLTILMGSFGNEIFNSRFIRSDKGLWWYPMQERMINTNRNMELTDEGVITHWEATDNNLRWEFTVREGATFHNGDPITPEDIAFSLQWAISEESITQVKNRLADLIVKHAHVTSPNTVKVLFKQPYATLPTYISSIVASGGSAGIITSKAYWDSVGGAEGYEQNPIPGAAGPFLQTSHLRGEEIVYEVWEDHFRKDPEYAFEEMSIKMVPEQSTQLAALRAGSADIIPADLLVIDQIRVSGARVIFVPESTVIWINAWNGSKDAPQTHGKDKQGRPLMCADQRIRYALDYAIDKKAIQEFFGGPEVFQIKGLAAVSPSGLGYQPDLKPFPYDPEKARQLMAEAGYPNGEGFNYGEPFQIWTWDAGATAPRIPELAQVICSMWQKELNINCEINVGEEVSIKEKQYGGQIPGQYIIRSNEHDYDARSKYKGRFATPSGSYISYDPDIEVLVDKALATIGSQEERAEAYYKMHKAVMDAHWDFTPGYLNAPYGVTNEIESWEPWPMHVHPSALWTIRWK